MATPQGIWEKIRILKNASGSHSPSIRTMLEEIPDLKVRIDACFLSNPYATDLFLQYLEEDLLKGGNLRNVLEFYPPQASAVAKSVSRLLDIDSKKIFVSNGAAEAIQAVIHRFVGKKLAVILPTFSSYYEFVRPDTEVVFYQLQKSNNFELDPDLYLSFIKKNNADSVVLINPNNPNGGYVSKEALSYIVGELSDLKAIIIDESFIHFASEDAALTPLTFSDFVNRYKNVVIIKSMSKDFGVAGLRAGYALMNQEMVSGLLCNGYLWNVSGLADYFFQCYLRKSFQESYEILRKKYLRETQEFLAELAKNKNLRVYPSAANFALVELKGDIDSFDFSMKMLVNHGIYIRDCSDKRGLDGAFVRIAARRSSENTEVLNALLATLVD